MGEGIKRRMDRQDKRIQRGGPPHLALDVGPLTSPMMEASELAT